MIIYTVKMIEELNRYGEPMDLPAMQNAVGGNIEVAASYAMPNGRSIVAVVNEEGKLMGLPVNPIGTTLLNEMFGMQDVIVGNVLIASGDMNTGELYYPTEAEIAKVNEFI